MTTKRKAIVVLASIIPLQLLLLFLAPVYVFWVLTVGYWILVYMIWIGKYG